MNVRVGPWRRLSTENWCFWTVVLEKTLESPWNARRFDQSILKEISPEYSLEGLMLKLKLQYFGHLMQRTNSLGKIEGRRRGWQRMRWLVGITGIDGITWHQWTWVWASSGSWWLTGKPGMLQSMGLQRAGLNWATKLNWTEHTRQIHHIFLLITLSPSLLLHQKRHPH